MADEIRRASALLKKSLATIMFIDEGQNLVIPVL